MVRVLFYPTLYFLGCLSTNIFPNENAWFGADSLPVVDKRSAEKRSHPCAMDNPHPYRSQLKAKSLIVGRFRQPTNKYHSVPKYKIRLD